MNWLINFLFGSYIQKENAEWNAFMKGVGALQVLAGSMPSGLIDHSSLAKANREVEEIDEEVTFVDKATEVGDVMYYMAKGIATGLINEAAAFVFVQKAAQKVGAPCSVKMAVEIAIAKYQFRTRPGNPKDKDFERKLADEVILSLTAPFG